MEVHFLCWWVLYGMLGSWKFPHRSMSGNYGLDVLAGAWVCSQLTVIPSGILLCHSCRGFEYVKGHGYRSMSGNYGLGVLAGAWVGSQLTVIASRILLCHSCNGLSVSKVMVIGQCQGTMDRMSWQMLESVHSWLSLLAASYSVIVVEVLSMSRVIGHCQDTIDWMAWQVLESVHSWLSSLAASYLSQL